MFNLLKILHIIFIVITASRIILSQPWVELNSGVTAQLNYITFTNSFTGYAAGVNVLIKTTNEGLTWFTSHTGIGQLNITKVSFGSTDTGYAIGDSAFQNKTYKTTNGGQSWFMLNQQASFKDIHFVNGNTGYAAGYMVSKTINGGQNWVYQQMENVYYTTALCMINGLTGYTAGARTEHPLDRTGISYTENGSAWTLSYTSSGYIIFKMGSFYDKDNGAFLSQSGSMYRKKNGGSWIINNTAFNSMNYVSANLVYACGSSGLISKSVNGGDNWDNSNSGVNFNFHSVCFINGNTGYVCGENGKILKTTNGGGITSIQGTFGNVPLEFSLSQNYPNPFNPITSFEFQISSSGFVALTVFDALGKEVATIVNQSLSPGTYRAEFDGSNYPSGVYYYRLESDDFTETKKMVLIK